MKLLILGGTLFLGRHLVAAAHARGHRVTLFNRGQTNAGVFPDVERLRGNRDGDLAALHGRQWDAVIDTSGYVPRLVHASATVLADAVHHYTFISSGSVYAELSHGTIDEHAPLETLADPTTEDVAAQYGALKALCEHAAEEAMPGRVLTVRAGLIVGPYDPTDRFTYWPRRVAQAGVVLAPGRPERQIQLIHARDLADWIVRMAEAQQTGVYNVTGPADMLTMGQLLETCRAACASDAQFVWVDETFLLEHDVAPFTDLPLWLPEAANSLLRMNIDRALAAGITFRSLADTITETLVWDQRRAATPDTEPRRLASGVPQRAGLAPARETALLAAWHARVGA